MNKHRSKKYAIISLLVVMALALPMLAMLPELSQGVEIQVDSSSLVIKQTAEDGLDIAVNWGSWAPPPVKPFNPPNDAVEIAVNWGSYVPSNGIQPPPIG